MLLRICADITAPLNTTTHFWALMSCQSWVHYKAENRAIGGVAKPRSLSSLQVRCGLVYSGLLLSAFPYSSAILSQSWASLCLGEPVWPMAEHCRGWHQYQLDTARKVLLALSGEGASRRSLATGCEPTCELSVDATLQRLGDLGGLFLEKC